jgi:hypothetical protein
MKEIPGGGGARWKPKHHAPSMSHGEEMNLKGGEFILTHEITARLAWIEFHWPQWRRSHCSNLQTILLPLCCLSSGPSISDSLAVFFGNWISFLSSTPYTPDESIRFRFSAIISACMRISSIFDQV